MCLLGSPNLSSKTVFAKKDREENWNLLLLIASYQRLLKPGEATGTGSSLRMADESPRSWQFAPTSTRVCPCHDKSIKQLGVVLPCALIESSGSSAAMSLCPVPTLYLLAELLDTALIYILTTTCTWCFWKPEAHTKPISIHPTPATYASLPCRDSRYTSIPSC